MALPLTARGRRVRLWAGAAVLLALVAGTAWGEDDHFPFGPFRMYATTTTDRVSVSELHGTTAAGKKLLIDFDDLGIRRAEVEGQIPRFRSNPLLLGHLVEAYERFNPEGPRLVELRLVEQVQLLSKARSVASTQKHIAVWQRP